MLFPHLSLVEMSAICGSLNESGLHRLINLNIWLTDGVTLREVLEGVASLEEGCHGGRLKDFKSPNQPQFSLPPVCR